MTFQTERARALTRRHFLKQSQSGLGALALASLMGRKTLSSDTGTASVTGPLAPKQPHFTPKAKHVIYLHMAGSPPQQELFDDKPALRKYNLKPCPDSLLEVLKKERLPFIKLSRGRPKLLGSPYKFQQRGECGMQISELLPNFSRNVDDVCLIRSMFTDQFNHAPAQLLLYTGSPRLGRPSMGAWITYGLGSENENLPGFVVLVSGQHAPSAGKSVWGSGFLPSVYQGVQCRSEGDPVLFVSDPEGMPRDLRRRSIEAINKINQVQHEEVGDPEILSRIAQYEMAFRMQLSVPEAMDLSKEPEWIHEMYGTEPGATSFANNCLLARRLAERGVRFIQLFHWGWDAHGAGRDEALNLGHTDRCREVDQPMTALLRDLKQRGLLDETLVVWGGEFGRTPILGRDHLGDAFTMWMAGGGVKQGFTYGETDEIGYTGIAGRVHIHDLQATILHLLGMDHERLTYLFQGRRFRLTDVHGEVVHRILA